MRACGRHAGLLRLLSFTVSAFLQFALKGCSPAVGSRAGSQLLRILHRVDRAGVLGMMFGLCVVCALMSHDNASSSQTLLCIACVLVRCVRSSQQAVRATIDDGHTALPERELCDGRV